MEHMIQLHIEKLPEGVYLTTSDDVQGLIAQGRTLQETVMAFMFRGLLESRFAGLASMESQEHLPWRIFSTKRLCAWLCPVGDVS